MTLAHKIDGLLTISKIQNSLEKVLIDSKIMYRKVSEFKIQFNRWLEKLLSLIPLFWHKKVTENVVDSRRRVYHWAATGTIDKHR